MSVRSLLQRLHPAARNVDSCAVGGEGLGCHEPDACTSACDDTDVIFDGEEVVDVEG